MKIENESKLGVTIRYRFDGGFFNLRQLKSKRHTSTTMIFELQYSDDNAVPSLTESDLQTTCNAFVHVYELFCLTLSLARTKVLSKISN